jgi:hypothetical protein
MECAICLEEGKLILFNHENKCGDILVHDSCLTEWFIKNDNECIICRENLVNDYALLESDEEPLQVENIRIDNNLSFDDILKILAWLLFFVGLFILFFILLFNQI